MREICEIDQKSYYGISKTTLNENELLITCELID